MLVGNKLSPLSVIYANYSYHCSSLDSLPQERCSQTCFFSSEFGEVRGIQLPPTPLLHTRPPQRVARSHPKFATRKKKLPRHSLVISQYKQLCLSQWPIRFSIIESSCWPITLRKIMSRFKCPEMGIIKLLLYQYLRSM